VEGATGCRRRSMGRCDLPARRMGKASGPEPAKPLDGEKDNWKPNLTVVRATVQFLQETGRLTYQPEEEQAGCEKNLRSFYII
jgi:hypothetical protein